MTTTTARQVTPVTDKKGREFLIVWEGGRILHCDTLLLTEMGLDATTDPMAALAAAAKAMS